MARRATLASLLLLAVGLAAALGRAADQEWPAISPAEWALKDDPANPGASAVILYRDSLTDDQQAYSRNYYRIKILKEEGKKYGDISIRFFKGRTRIQDVEAHTVHPDGRVIDFDGTTYDKEVVKARGVNYLARTFTLPDVQPGSIIEYRYTVHWDPLPAWVFNNPDAAFYFSQVSPSRIADRWVVQEDLFTKRAHFSFKPIPNFGLSWTWSNLPATANPASQQGVVQLDVENIPGFQAEDYMPPEDVLKGRVEFFYFFSPMPKNAKDSSWFWKQEGEKHAKSVEQFIGKEKNFSREVDSLVQPSDSPEVKLRKIYARVQQIRNLSFEPEKTQQEEKRQKLSDNNTAADVLKHGYGWGYEINELFVGMARAAGFDAALAEVTQRRERFYNPQLLDWSQLNANLAVVSVGGKDQFFDPATRFCPYGLVPWEENTTHGFRLDRDGAAELAIPVAPSSDTVISRKATLQIADDGGVKGEFELTFTGQDALERRLDNRERDDTGRRKALEDELKTWFPAGATVTLDKVTGWDNGDEPLKIGFSIDIEGSQRLGLNRLLYPALPFPGEVKYFFQSAQRLQPVYITYPYEEVDDLTLQLPKNMRVESLPAAQNNSGVLGSYQLSLENQGNAVHIQRHFMLQQGLIPAQYYPNLRGFLTAVRQGDETRMVLRSVPPGQPGGGL